MKLFGRFDGYRLVKNYLTALMLSIAPLLLMGQQVKQYESFDLFESEILQRTSSDTIYVVNFWATWCAPCVHELPYFANVDARITDRPIKVILASLDFKRQLKTKFYPWLEEHPQTHEVVLLLDPKSNTWIDKVDPAWSGAIPFTYVYHRKKRSTYEGSFANSDELDAYINAFINSL